MTEGLLSSREAESSYIEWKSRLGLLRLNSFSTLFKPVSALVGERKLSSSDQVSHSSELILDLSETSLHDVSTFQIGDSMSHQNIH
jgi:hypothetical protein